MNADDKQILGILGSIEQIENMIRKQNTVNMELINDIHDAILEINQAVFNTEKINNNEALKYIDLLGADDKNLELFIIEVDKWRNLITQTVKRRFELPNKIDREFYIIMDYVTVTDYTDMVANCITNLRNIRTINEDYYQQLKQFYGITKDFWGNLNVELNDFDVFEQRCRALKDHQEDFIWLYERLEDYRSKMVLSGILRNWLYFDLSILFQIKENNFADYFDLDLVTCNENEVFVDIGAYNGDSAKSFIETYGQYKKIYCYEITEESVLKCHETLSAYDNIEIRNKGVGSENKTMYFHKFGLSGSSNMVKEQGEIPVDIVSIDNDITEKVTFIKMDIEGAEQEALKGCKKHIMNEHPKLTICTYHNNEDIWKIPRMIEEMDSNYHFYMRYNGSQLGPTEYVLFAL